MRAPCEIDHPFPVPRKIASFREEPPFEPRSVLQFVRTRVPSDDMNELARFSPNDHRLGRFVGAEKMQPSPLSGLGPCRRQVTWLGQGIHEFDPSDCNRFSRNRGSIPSLVTYSEPLFIGLRIELLRLFLNGPCGWRSGRPTNRRRCCSG